MNFFKEEKLYKVEIIKKCCVMDAVQCSFGRNYLPNIDSDSKGNFGFIPVGTTGYVVEKFGNKYFIADENQEGLDLFMPANQTDVLISYDKIKDCYKLL